MATQYGIQPAFSKGELTPRLHARVDIEYWKSGVAKLTNWIVMRQGGLRRRPGTMYVASTKFQAQSDKVRPVPFEFSPAQSYVLELGDHYMRVHGLGGTVMVGGAPYEISAPWAGADLALLQTAQSNDVLYITHPNYPPYKILRFLETDWSITPVVFEDGPYLDIDKSGASFSPSQTGDLIPTMTGDSAPSGVASASGSYADPVSHPYYAFDRDRGTDWTSDVSGAVWLKYQFPTAKVVTGYAVRASNTILTITDNTGTSGSNTVSTIYRIPGSLRAPRNWTFEGSNDDLNWSVLDTQAAQTGWGDGERRYYTFRNDVSFLYYRLNIQNANVSERPTSVAELSLQGGGADAQIITLAASNISGINKGSGFLSTDVGRHLRLLSEDTYWHWFEIVSVVASNSITVRFRSPPLPSVKSIASWRLGAFSATTGYPQAITFFQERLCYGGTSEQPQTIWGSKTGDFDNYGVSIPLKPDDSFTFTFGAAGAIQWLADNGDLIVGTTGAIRTLGPADKNQAFSATNVTQGKPALVGAAPIQPVSAGGAPVFVGKFLNNVREASYSFDAQGYVSPDISILSEHLFHSGVTSIAFAQIPDSIIWCSMGDGSLVGITHEREQQMIAIHHHELGGNGFVEWVVKIPGVASDEVWLSVRRIRPDGSPVRTLERVSKSFEDRPAAEAFLVDCGLTYSGAPTVAISGLTHLDGFAVAALADGATEASATVSGGALALPSGIASSLINVGFAYTSEGETLPIAQGLGDGSGLGRKKRIKKLIFNLMETGALKVKATSRSYQDLILRSASSNMDSPSPLVTGDVDTHIDDQWGGRGVSHFICDGPQPATIRAITLAFDGEP